MVERLLRKQKVAGSIPVVGFTFGRFADHVEMSVTMSYDFSVRQCSLAVEHPLSKREVVGSNPAIGLFACARVFDEVWMSLIASLPKTLCPSG